MASELNNRRHANNNRHNKNQTQYVMGFSSWEMRVCRRKQI